MTCKYSKQIAILEIHKAYWRISDSLVKLKRIIVETVDAWNFRITEVTRKKDGDKKDKPVTVELESPAAEEVFIFSESQENLTLAEKESVTISKKVKSIDSSDSMLLMQY